MFFVAACSWHWVWVLVGQWKMWGRRIALSLVGCGETWTRSVQSLLCCFMWKHRLTCRDCLTLYGPLKSSWTHGWNKNLQKLYLIIVIFAIFSWFAWWCCQQAIRSHIFPKIAQHVSQNLGFIQRIWQQIAR